MNKDLKFLPHPNGLGGVQCKIKTDNGYTISIVGGGIGLYGDGVNTFEVAAWEGDNGEWIKLSPYNDVLAHQSIDRVHEVINDISNGIIKQYETI
jgi:hypothetical protein